MFAAHRVTIDAPYSEVLSRLTHFINWGALRDTSQEAFDGGLTILMRVGPFGGLPGLSKLVRVRTLQPVHRGGRTTIALRWEATGVAGELFPALDAHLTLTPTDNDRSIVELVGTYRPPLGKAGKVLDRAVMESVADATIRSFIEKTGAVLSHPIHELGTQTPPPFPLPLVNPEET
jgi:hypothetical protein